MRASAIGSRHGAAGSFEGLAVLGCAGRNSQPMLAARRGSLACQDNEGVSRSIRPIRAIDRMQGPAIHSVHMRTMTIELGCQFAAATGWSRPLRIR
jgi:hypothetical protein